MESNFWVFFVAQLLRGPSPTRILTSLAYSLVAAAEPSSVSQPGWVGGFCMGSLGILVSFVTMKGTRNGIPTNWPTNQWVSLQGEVHPEISGVISHLYITYIYTSFIVTGITWFLGRFEGIFFVFFRYR